MSQLYPPAFVFSIAESDTNSLKSRHACSFIHLKSEELRGVQSELRPQPGKSKESGESPFQKEQSVGTGNAKKALFGAKVGNPFTC
jgi:hypothetical protein